MIQPVTTASKFRISFLSWWMVWIFVQWLVISSYGFDSTISITDSFVCNILLAGACLLITNNMKFYLPQKERYWYILITSVVISAIWLFAVKSILHIFFKNDPGYTVFLERSLYIRFVIGFLMTGCMAIIGLLWYTLREQQAADKRKEEAEQMTKDAELSKLRQQLQPHFLFNSLNSISALAGSQPEKARHMIQQLSDFLRGTLKRDNHQHVSLEEELHHLGLYLDIEKVRFGRRLQTEIMVSGNASMLRLPSLLLQPVVENAIKFGLYDTTEMVMIRIEAGIADKDLFITVTNPFDEATSVSTQGTGFGLVSIRRRLYLLFARNDLLVTEKKDNRFITHIRIPQYLYESNHH